ncbi:MAG: hypothetical protein Q8N26_30205 [Myxococcales bacterium]|nr:hypothetical protein [Myxococcales bacterium]
MTAATTEPLRVARSGVPAARREVRLQDRLEHPRAGGIRGVVSAEYFTVVDRGDDAGLALRLEPALADGLAQLLGNLTAAEAASQKARATVTACQRDLDAAIFGLQSVVAQGRAVLASFGVKLTRKKAKKKVEAKVEQPAPQPETMPIAA